MSRAEAATITIADSAYNDGAADGLYEILTGRVFDVHVKGDDTPLEEGLIFNGVVEHNDEWWFDMVKHDDDSVRRLFPLFGNIELRYC